MKALQARLAIKQRSLAMMRTGTIHKRSRLLAMKTRRAQPLTHRLINAQPAMKRRALIRKSQFVTRRSTRSSAFSAWAIPIARVASCAMKTQIHAKPASHAVQTAIAAARPAGMFATTLAKYASLAVVAKTAMAAQAEKLARQPTRTSALAKPASHAIKTAIAVA